MNVRYTSKGDRRKGYENAQRNVHHQNVTPKPFAYCNVLKPSLPLSDESEFPSLNEISRKVPTFSQPGDETSKYSDKLKLHSSAQIRNSSSSFTHLNDTVLTNSYRDRNPNIHGSQFSNKGFNDGIKSNFNLKGGFQTNKQKETDESGHVNKKIINANSSDISKGYSNLRESHYSKYHENKNQSPKQKHLVNTSSSMSHNTHKLSIINSNCSSHSKLSNQTQSKNELKFRVENTPVKDSTEVSGNSTAKKKKKRKSKVKRQVALQTGKITVLTPEVHSKILNQTSALTSRNFRSVLTDINDEEEYPELGKSLIPSSQKENFPKKESNTSLTLQEALDKKTDTAVDKESIIVKDVTVKDSTAVTLPILEEKLVIEKKGKSESKFVHPNDPITVSFYDILVNKNFKTKVKNFKVEADSSPCIGLAKKQIKKNSSHPHNILDSSAPAIKRGKEREKPKPKKPSHLKKIILLDRKVRREQLLQLKDNSFEKENAVTGNESEEVSEVDTNETSNHSDNNFENDSFNAHAFQLELREENDHLLPLDDCGLNLPVDSRPVVQIKNISTVTETQKSGVTSEILSSVVIPAEKVEVKHFSEEDSTNTHLEKVSVNEKDGLAHSGILADSSLVEKVNKNLSRSDLLLDSFKNHDKKLDSSDREKAVKILLHTRNFREYCNHLISKDIDDVVLALLDDLARFQDRLHQKDPVKARMKRRMVYGVKEVKKHIKMKKLKSIVIAADIENVEAQGGLNDFLNDIKSSAADHHIPCVFALSRKVLGKVCRKPVPVSCVGVFNYEGSEANFRKMVELQTQSKVDYVEISSKLSESLTEDQIVSLLKAKKEAPEALSSIRRNILGDFFLEPKSATSEHEKTDVESESASNSSDTEV